MAVPKILLFYVFTPLADPDAIRLWQRDLCESLGLGGRIILSKDGMNGTVGGELKNVKRYIRKTREYAAFKTSTSSGARGRAATSRGSACGFATSWSASALPANCEWTNTALSAEAGG